MFFFIIFTIFFYFWNVFINLLDNLISKIQPCINVSIGLSSGMCMYSHNLRKATLLVVGKNWAPTDSYHCFYGIVHLVFLKVDRL